MFGGHLETLSPMVKEERGHDLQCRFWQTESLNFCQIALYTTVIKVTMKKHKYCLKRENIKFLIKKPLGNRRK